MIVADDVGMSDGINEATVRASATRKKIVRAMTVTGVAYEAALAQAQEDGVAGVGLHINVTEGCALLPPECISGLVNKDGRFRRGPWALSLAMLFGRVPVKEVCDEIDAQFQKITEAGISVVHVSGHHHIHIFPLLGEKVLCLARKYGIVDVRFPYERLRWANGAGWWQVRRTVGQCVINLLCCFARKTFIQQGFRVDRRFIGFLQGGRLTDAVLDDILATQHDEAYEIMCHPRMTDGNGYVL